MKLEHQRISDPRPIVCLDLEAGGLDPAVHPILQIGAIRLDPTWTLEQDRLSLYVLPPRGAPIDPKAQAVNGYDRALWLERGAIELDDALRQLARFSGGWRIPTDAAAHNGRAFDFQFLSREYLRRGCDSPWALELDTLHLARALGAPVVSLAQTCRFFSVQHDRRKAHEALYDAERVALILQAARRDRAPSREAPKAWQKPVCEHCGAALIWARSTPFNADSPKTPHRETCPLAHIWSRRAREAQQHAPA